MRLAVSLLLLTVVFWSPALGTTDLERFKHKVEKSAPDLNALDPTPPVVCICKDGSGSDGHAGHLISRVEPAGPVAFRVLVYCGVLDFVGGQIPIGGAFACNQWVLLPK